MLARGLLATPRYLQRVVSAAPSTLPVLEDTPILRELPGAKTLGRTSERVIRTLRAWNIRIDEALFLGGLDKGEFLRAFGADFFFDDQRTHVESAAKHVASGHVPHGVANE